MSNKLFIRKIISSLCCAVFAATFIVVMFFTSPKIEAIPETTGTFEYTVVEHDENGVPQFIPMTVEIGKDVTAVRINDLKKIGKLTKVNYVPGRFVQGGQLSSDIQIVDLTEPFEFAEKGTLIFIIANLDPHGDDFYDRADALSDYKFGDNWCFTLSIPEIFSASNIYNKSTLIARNGTIEGYDFKEFNTNYDRHTDVFSEKTQTTYTELKFYTKRSTMERELSSSQVITIHYQTDNGVFSGIKDAPLIGAEEEVMSIEQNSRNLLVSFAVLAAAVFAVLVVLSIVERSKEFAAPILWIFGISVLLLARFFMCGATTAPKFWLALSLGMSFLILIGAQLAICRNLGKFRAKLFFASLSGLGMLLAFIYPYVPYSAAYAVGIASKVIKAISVASVLFFIGLALASKNDKHSALQTSITTIISVAVLTSFFMPQVFPAQYNPNFWLCVASTVATFLSVVNALMNMKKSNVYLTENLHMEVERQVKDIKAVIEDRDNLLQFVSHDMKKPLSSAVMLCETAMEREKDSEQVKTIGIIKQDAERVIANLSEIAAYAKLNYLSETSKTVDICEFCQLLYKYHEFDCDANGIILKNNVERSVKAFVKQTGLENVVSNIIINAIEHANCKTVTLSLKLDRNRVVLVISDDGKGIDKDLDVFKPYISENNDKTSGLGLYICKNIIESMNGELSYESGPSGTSFFISLLKA